MTTQRKVKLICQQCGESVDTVVVIHIDSDGNETHHMQLMDGWRPIWVPDDEKAKMTCGRCQT